MKIYLDPLGQQIQTQVSGATCKLGITKPGERLKTFFKDIEAAFGADAYTIGKESDLSDCVYPTYDVLVLTNRINYTYDKETLANILNFVHSGGGLWCMSNHAGFKEGSFQLNDHVAFDSAVTTVFFTSLQAAAYGSKDPSNNKVILDGENLYPHPTVTGQEGCHWLHQATQRLLAASSREASVVFTLTPLLIQ
ncbi:MAG: hypothetical protein MI700_05875 [Balneolales bacterium]|nr:hypothetical protein [Balneolales bacterium]